MQPSLFHRLKVARTLVGGVPELDVLQGPPTLGAPGDVEQGELVDVLRSNVDLDSTMPRHIARVLTRCDGGVHIEMLRNECAEEKDMEIQPLRTFTKCASPLCVDATASYLHQLAVSCQRYNVHRH